MRLGIYRNTVGFVEAALVAAATGFLDGVTETRLVADPLLTAEAGLLVEDTDRLLEDM